MAAKGEREVRVRFTGESAVLKGAGGEVRKVFQMMMADINDTRDAAEKMAAAQAQVADSMRKDMAAIATAADVVRDSLGPEMVAAIESSGRSVEDQVQEWRKLGLTLDDIKAGSDQLAAGMKNLDDAARMSTGSVGDGMKKMADNSTKARSAMANFAGNAVQELPVVAGMFGPLNMGISQLVEGLAEGDMKFKQLLTAGLAMGAVGLLLSELTDNTEELQDAQMDAFKSERVRTWAKAIRDAGNGAEALKESLSGAQEIMGLFRGEALGFGDAMIDLVPLLDSAGLDIDDWTRAMEGGEAGIAELERQLKASNLTLLQQTVVLTAAKDTQLTWVSATDLASSRARFFKDSVSKLTGEIESSRGPVDDLADAYDDIRAAMDKTGEAYDDLTGKLDDDTTYQNLMLDFDALQEELAGYRQAVKDGTMTQEEASRRSAIAINNQKGAVADYAEEVLGLPPEAVTDIFTNIDNGELIAAKSLVDQLTSKTHTIKFASNLVSAFAGKYGGFGGADKQPGSLASSDGESLDAGRRGDSGPVVIQVVMDGRVVGEAVTSYQEMQKRGSR